MGPDTYRGSLSACMVIHWEDAFVLGFWDYGLVDILHIHSHSQNSTLSEMSLLRSTALGRRETEIEVFGSESQKI